MSYYKNQKRKEGIREIETIRSDSLNVNIPSSISDTGRKNVICPDLITCKGRHMIINPKNNTEYLCPNCGDTLPIKKATPEKSVKAVFDKNRQNTFVISQQDKKRQLTKDNNESDLPNDDIPEQAQIISDETIYY